ncbi:MAG: hypothetical protein GEU71_05675 [Actinobacteria bacterium]|nr:hypothetical protein [Actinomycetota bacterium]
MSTAVAAPREGSFKAPIYVFVTIAGVAAGLTLLYLGMRAVMDIGGACADGGPYVPRVSCPQGVPLAMFGGIWGGLIMCGLYAVVSIRYRVPSFLGFAWPALFVSLGWNFIDFGIDPPGDMGLVWGWLICGALFMLMGAGPLLVVLKPVLRSFNRRPEDRPVGLLEPVKSMRTQALDSMFQKMSTAEQAAGGDAGPDLVTKLERLERLHRGGSLSEAEYTAAKEKLLGGA